MNLLSADNIGTIVPETNGKTINALIVESEPVDFLYLSKVLMSENPDIKITQTQTLSEAIMKLIIYKNLYDVIFLEINLPDKQGMETVKEINKLFLKIPVIVISNLNDKYIAAQCIKLGITDYLIKGEVTTTQILTAFHCTFEKYERSRELEVLSVMDELTQLYNRRGLYQASSQLLKLAKRLLKDINVFFIDINYLKQINDNYGHRYGDKAIKETARVLKNSFRDSDIISRISGDEFVVFALGNFEDQNDIINSIIKRLENNLYIVNQDNKMYNLSISIGMVTFPYSLDDIQIEELLEKSDQALYRAKINKHNSLVSFSL